MMSQTQWAAWNVQDFFSGYNWLGKPPQFAPLESTEATIEPDGWLCFSVRDFLIHGNWTGKTLSKRPESSPIPLTLAVTLPVSEFFRLMVWENTSPVTPVFPSIPTAPLTSPSQELNLNHLSDLF